MAENRRLAAIIAIDVVGFSRLMGEDEAGTARAVREHRDAARPLVKDKGGRIVKTMGDGLLLEFPSVVAAVECAVEIQALMIERNIGVPDDKRIVYRIGVNLGDVLIDGDDILGDGVNIAARLESICAPGGVLISGEAHNHVRGRTALSFVDLGDKALKNIARPVRVFAVGAQAASSVPTPKAAASKKSGPPQLSIVVLPFASLGGGEEHGYFVDGVTESLTTDLSRIRGSFVIGRNTAFTYKDKAVDLKQIGRELNVRYALEGSVQRRGDRLRVNVQLIEVDSGSHLWAERFDKPLTDLFVLQDDIVARLANALGAQLIEAEARQAEKEISPNSMDFYFQGQANLNRGANPDNLRLANDFFERALAADPSNVEALVSSARVDLSFRALGLLAGKAAQLADAEAKLQKALFLAPDHARAHLVLGTIYILTKRCALGIVKCEHALELDRNLANAHAWIGFGKTFVGRALETEAHVIEALRLSPRDVQSYLWMNWTCLAKQSLGLYEEALLWGQRAINANPNYAVAHFVMSAVLVRLNLFEEAHAAVKAGLALDPAFTLSRVRANWTAQSDEPNYLAYNERRFEDMRKAGVPE